MGLLGWLRRSTPKLATDGLSEAVVRETTDYVVRMCDPRIALLSRYRERLAPAVVAALRFVQKQREMLGEPVDANVSAWHSTPLLRAIFATTDEMQQAFGRSTELVEWFARNPLRDVAVATLGMVAREQRVLGMALDGELIQRDVVQTTLSFSDHRTRIFSDSPESLWRGVARRLVDELAYIALSHFEAEQTTRKQLEDELALMRARLRAFERRGTGMDHLAAGRDVPDAVVGRKLLHQLEENERKLAQMPGNADLLELRLSMLADTLSHAESYVHIGRRSLHVDSLNQVFDDASPDTNPISFIEVKVDRNPPLERVLVALRIHRSALQPAGMRLDDAARMLG